MDEPNWNKMTLDDLNNTDDAEHKLNCLARWIINRWDIRAQRLSFLDRMQRNHGMNFTNDLRRRMNVEMRNRREEKEKTT